jgi:hypothetical protein
MTDPAGNQEWLFSCRDQVSDVGVPKVVEPDAWQGALDDQPVESLGHRLRVHCPPVGLGEDESVVGIARAHRQPVRGHDEAGAYFDWLARRTRNLLRHPRFWPAVEAVAGALCEKDRLSGQSIREIITTPSEDEQAKIAAFVQRFASKAPDAPS